MTAARNDRTDLLFLSLGAALAACSVASHPSQPGHLGIARRSSDLLAVIDQPGPLEVETVNSADWQVARSGLINLDNPVAKAARLQDGDEPIQVFFHVVHHPTQGTFLIDTGFERALRDAPGRAAPSRFVKSFMHLEKLKFHQPLADWLEQQTMPPAGVFMTHLHLDHAGGSPDLPRGTPIYVGPKEGTSRAFLNLFAQGTTDRDLDGKGPLQEWPFRPDADGRFEGVVDVFGDGSLWALLVPGHTEGSTAYLARTTKGPVLFTGDTCHTAWGWNHGVEPGSFTSDRAKNAESLERLKRLVAEHPAIDVRLGHQYLTH
jgi:N-acyl homoserine lactone hydrolase